jgi:hypothetical protein
MEASLLKLTVNIAGKDEIIVVLFHNFLQAFETLKLRKDTLDKLKGKSIEK